VTIAAVRGYALGGGCMLAAAQDLRVAEASARFGPPGSDARLQSLLRHRRDSRRGGGRIGPDLLLTGRPVDAAEALRMGLVTRVVPDGELENATNELAAAIAQHPRGGLAATKAIVADIRAGKSGGAAQAYAAPCAVTRTPARASPTSWRSERRTDERVLITGTRTLKSALEDKARRFPDQLFLIFEDGAGAASGGHGASSTPR
jgi:enoyl-CoA hydratase/carnithine racemase